jgi:hypothetical protein
MMQFAPTANWRHIGASRTVVARSDFANTFKCRVATKSIRNPSCNAARPFRCASGPSRRRRLIPAVSGRSNRHAQIGHFDLDTTGIVGSTSSRHCSRRRPLTFGISGQRFVHWDLARSAVRCLAQWATAAPALLPSGLRLAACGAGFTDTCIAAPSSCTSRRCRTRPLRPRTDRPANTGNPWYC